MKKFVLMALGLLAAIIPTFSQNTDKPLRIAVAGVDHGHLWNVVNAMGRGDIEVVGVWEADDAHRADNIMTGKLPAKLFFADLDKMLDKVKPEAVVCYGPTVDHLKVVEACAPRHIDVMVEKPLATTYKDALRMEELAKQYGTNVLTNYETSWYNTNTYAKQLVDDNRVGKVFRINVYDGHQGPFEIGCSKMFTDWLTDPVKNGGGAVTDFGCYGANLATWILKNETPVSVSAVLRTNKPDVYPKVDDDATITVNYKNCVLNIFASWCWPMNRKDMYIYGLKGYIYQKDGKAMETQLDGEKKRSFEAPALQAPFDDTFRYLNAVVRKKIQVQPTDLASVENNVLVVRILEAAKESSRTGKTIFF